MPKTSKQLSCRQPNALVIGAMNLDVLAIASQTALAEESTPGKVTTSAGGVGRNVAEGLSRLGICATMVSAVGKDDAGNQLLQHCRSAGINTDHVLRVDGANTSSYVSVHGHDGALLYAISDMDLMDQYHSDQLPGLRQWLHNADICVIDTNLPEVLIADIAGAKGQTALVADAVSVAKCQRLASVLSALTLLKANQHEAEALTGCSANTPLQVVIEKCLALGPETVLMTLGSEGALVASYENGSLKITYGASPDVAIKSVNGAGDALMAGFLAAALYGHNTDEQLRWGKVAAGTSLATQNACCELLSVDSMQ